MRRIHHLEHIVPIHETETGPGGLQIVHGLSHVTLGAEAEGRDAVVGVGDGLGGTDLVEAEDELGVGQAGVAEDCAAGLEGLDDFVGLVAGEGEAGGGGVDFHCASEGLLGAGGHAMERIMVNFNATEDGSRKV